MITRIRPFTGDSATAMFQAILDCKPTPVTSLRSDFPDAIEPIIARALAKDRETRYQTAAELHEDLRSLERELEIESTLANPSAPGPQLAPSVFSVRRSAFPLVAAVLLVALAAGIFYWLKQSATISTPPQVKYDLAIEKYRKALELDPTFTIAIYALAVCYEQKGMYDQAIAEYRKISAFSDSKMGTAGLGYVYAISGKTAQAKAVLRELTSRSAPRASPYHIARIYAALGENDQSLSWLEKAYEERDERIVMLKVDPKLDRLRSDHRFTELLQRVRLVS